MDGPAVLPPVGRFTWEHVARTVKAWRHWVAKCRYTGPYREAVVRSALALKLLTFGPSGGVVAVPTTSLPEVPGGKDNWDYRFCWVRDAAFTARAFYGLGYEHEAEAFVSWLLRATWLTQPRMNVFYDVYGRVRGGERELSHLRGYEGSRPVRVGNAAATQLQLDAYGEAIDAVAQLARRGGHLDRDGLKMLRRFGEYVTKVWERPDEGIWEPRSGRSEHTFSKVSCWMALERLVELHGRGVFRDVRVPVDRFRKVREQLREEIRTRGWNQRLHSYVRKLDGDEVDADPLLLSWYGFTSTLVLTGLLAGSQRLRLTRMNLPLLLGTMLTVDRDRAKLYGLGLHLLLGLLFSGVYVAAFAAWGRASWWLGGLLGVLHAGFVLMVLLPVMPALHPRMASESQSPTDVRQLEPPGFLGLHYGTRTPLTALVSHVVFGVLLGGLFRL